MKKIILLLLIMFFSVQLCFAEGEEEEDISRYFNTEPEQTKIFEGYVEYNQDAPLAEESAIELEEPTDKRVVNISKPQKIESRSLIYGSKKATFHPMQDELAAASKFSSQEYNIKPVSTTYSRKYGKFSFGTMYGSSMSKARANYSTGLFAKYEGKHAALSMGFSKNTNSNYDSYKDEVFIAPELKVTQRLSLLDVMQTDVYQINKSNELVLRYTPRFNKNSDDIQFEVGAGQSFYEDSFIKSSLRFSTKFKF